MIDGLRPYAEMKPTGLPWLGDVPAHWDVRRNGRLFAARRQTGFPNLPILEVSIRSGVRVRDFDNGGRKQEIADRSKYQRAVKGDIAYNMMRMWQGAVGISPVDGLVSPAYVVARPFDETDPAYYAYLFRTATYMREIDVFSRGIVPDRNRLYWESFKQMPSVYPPLEEQRLIVRFLDWHGGQVARLVRAKKALIGLLNEQKQAIIHRAVTRGLDANANLKPSGIPWLGDVPEGWEVKRLKVLAQNKIIQTRFREPGEIYVALEHIESWSGRLIRRDYDTQFDSQVKAFIANDILFGKLRPYLAKVTRLDVGGVCVGEILVLRANGSVIDPAFLECRMRTSDFIELVNSSTFGAKMPRADWDFIGNVSMAFPTSLIEQQAVVGYLESATRELSAVITRVLDEIALIQEFRTRMIADVVTGKLDVRALAASLPETAAQEATLDQSDDEDMDDLPDDLEPEEAAA
jgi:type I restriction enzyme, S subunit